MKMKSVISKCAKKHELNSIRLLYIKYKEDTTLVFVLIDRKMFPKKKVAKPILQIPNAISMLLVRKAFYEYFAKVSCEI